MESLAYLHLALVYESPTDAEIVPLWEGKFFESLHRQKRYNIRTSLLLLMVALSVFGLVNEALAQQAFPGETGSNVEAIQERLQDRGYFYDRIDGVYGLQTEAAVRRFQRDQGLSLIDGKVGAETEAALFGGSRVVSSTRSYFDDRDRSYDGILQRGAQGERVEALQRQLRRLGFYYGDIDGDFGGGTERAVRAFQRSRGLVANGIANRRTLQALRLRPENEDRDNENPYVVAVPGDDETRREVQRVLRRNGIRGTASLGDSRLGTYVNAGAFSSREFAESRSFLLRGNGFKDARVIYNP